MPLGGFFSCVWLVLLALTLMTTFPRNFHCSCSSTPSSPSSSSSSASSSSSSSSTNVKSSQPEQHSATAAATSTSLCHNSIDTSDLISTNCEQPLREQHQQPRMRITGEINEGPGPPSCPPSCAADETARAPTSDKNSSCYRYLAPKDCEEPWLNDWSEIRLRHCCEHSIHEAVPDAQTLLHDREQCERHVNELLELDLFVAKVTCQFRHVLQRYDCLQKYSVNDCGTCREAYRRWVCASLIPHWRQRHKIKPCRSICHTVEQTCPWFLPADKIPGSPAQYAGEPIFQCIDANIPETGEQLLKSTYGSGCCYEYCEQRRNIEVSTASSYHHRVDKSKFPHTRIVSCLQGCNDSENDPSHDTKSVASSPCHNNARSSTVASATSKTAAAAAAAVTHSGTRANTFSYTISPWFLGSTVLAAVISFNSEAGFCGLR